MKGLLLLSLLVLLLAGCVPREVGATLTASAYFHDGYVEGVGWVFSTRPAGTAVVLDPGTATWADGVLWMRARPADGQYDAWVCVFDGTQWLVALP